MTGATSDYVRPEHWPRIQALFPAAERREIAGAGHWLHADEDYREAEEREGDVERQERGGAGCLRPVARDEVGLGRDAQGREVDADERALRRAVHVVEEAIVGEVGERVAEVESSQSSIASMRGSVG